MSGQRDPRDRIRRFFAPNEEQREVLARRGEQVKQAGKLAFDFLFGSDAESRRVVQEVGAEAERFVRNARGILESEDEGGSGSTVPPTADPPTSAPRAPATVVKRQAPTSPEEPPLAEAEQLVWCRACGREQAVPTEVALDRTCVLSAGPPRATAGAARPARRRWGGGRGMATAYGNRLVKPNADRTVTLKRGRLYRLLVVVNGVPGEEEIRQTVYAWGLDDHDTAVSWPGEWAEHRPKDWPKEGSIEDLPANEFLLRISGSMSGPTRSIGPDSPIAGNEHNGTLTIIGAWDYGPATEDAMRAPEPDQEDSEQETKTRSTVLWIGLGIFAAGMLYKFSNTRSGMSREQEHYDRIAQRADRARRAGRVRELIASGHDHQDAHAIAEHEEWDRAEHEHHALEHLGAEG